MNRSFWIFLLILTGLAPLFCACQKKTESQNDLFISAPFANATFSVRFEQNFEDYWKKKTGNKVNIIHEIDGAFLSPFSVLSGINTDVVWYSSGWLVEYLAGSNKYLAPDWQDCFPNKSCPVASTTAFIVKKGNPRHIKTWDDLLRNDVKILLTDPRFDSAGRYTFLALWRHSMTLCLKDCGGMNALNDPARKSDVEKARKKTFDFLVKVYQKAKSEGLSIRSAWCAQNFSKDNWDLTSVWEFEAMVTCKKIGYKIDIAYPNIHVRADFPVAIIQNNVKTHDSEKIANGFINFLYSKQMQNMFVEHSLRPTDPEVLKSCADQFPTQGLIAVEEFGNWNDSRKYFFEIDGLCEQVMQEVEKKTNF